MYIRHPQCIWRYNNTFNYFRYPIFINTKHISLIQNIYPWSERQRDVWRCNHTFNYFRSERQRGLYQCNHTFNYFRSERSEVSTNVIIHLTTSDPSGSEVLNDTTIHFITYYLFNLSTFSIFFRSERQRGAWGYNNKTCEYFRSSKTRTDACNS